MAKKMIHFGHKNSTQWNNKQNTLPATVFQTSYNIQFFKTNSRLLYLIVLNNSSIGNESWFLKESFVLYLCLIPFSFYKLLLFFYFSVIATTFDIFPLDLSSYSNVSFANADSPTLFILFVSSSYFLHFLPSDLDWGPGFVSSDDIQTICNYHISNV